MYKRVFMVVLAGVVAGTAGAQAPSTDDEKLSYAIGYDFGLDLGQLEGLQVESVIQAVRDAAAERDPQVPAEEMREILTALQQEIQEERLAQFEALAEENEVKAEQFLRENRNKSGIVALPSGVQYRVIEEGEGRRPSATDTVTVHYRGSKTDGREFDSSFARGVPAVFQVDSVLDGWQEVLPLMREGAMWQIFLPPELGFGLRGDPPLIGPNEALIFDLRLVQIGEPENNGE